MKFGRKRPSASKRSRSLKLRDYLCPGLPTPPAACDYTPQAAAALQEIYANDTVGDCVIAGYYHTLGVATGNATGTPYIATDADVLADYSAIGGYVLGDPATDNGCDESDALLYWMQHPAADGSVLAGFIDLDPCDVTHLQLACWLSCNLMFGLELPDAWTANLPSQSGFSWDAAGAPNPSNGHCVIGAGYDPLGITVATWGMTGCLTYDAIAEYGSAQAGGAVHALLTPDWLAKGQVLVPSGIDWQTLKDDLAELRLSNGVGA